MLYIVSNEVFTHNILYVNLCKAKNVVAGSEEKLEMLVRGVSKNMQRVE
jgi:hypothetical protein